MSLKNCDTQVCYPKKTEFLTRPRQETLFSTNIFDDILSRSASLFINREILRSTYVPDFLPHREKEIEDIAGALSPALRNETPSNLLVYGKPGTGKTAVIKFVGKLLVEKADESDKNVHFIYINCQFVETRYRILQKIIQYFSQKFKIDIPFTGWPTDELYSKTLSLVDKEKCSVVIVLDEADKLRGDDALYTLTRINSDLKNAKTSIICISNNLRFTEFLDPRVQSSLGEEQIIFNPYNARELQDILEERANRALRANALSDDVIPYCAALAAQEHGDARKALDLLRIASEQAERKNHAKVTVYHVKKALQKIENNYLKDVIKNLPQQIKLVLYAIIKQYRENEDKKISQGLSTGEIYQSYQELCRKNSYRCLTQRAVTEFFSELDMLGIINARTISSGMYGTTKKININFPSDIMKTLFEDQIFKESTSSPSQKQMSLL